MKKINVVGTSGSGKSTFAKKLSRQLNYPYIEMDRIYWGKNWSEPNDVTFFNKLEGELAQEYWVLDGNYTRSIPVKWKNVDTIVWIDFSFTRTLFQAIKRAVKRIISQQELWPETGNRETLRKLFSRDSIVLWTLKCYHSNKIKYGQLSQNQALKHVTIIRLTSPKMCQRFLTDLVSL